MIVLVHLVVFLRCLLVPTYCWRGISLHHHSNDFTLVNAVSCDDGDLRLVGGETEYEGLLEVCFSQRWGTVNGDGWSASDTQVACRQLGFDGI